jgi:hypothetical protein
MRLLGLLHGVLVTMVLILRPRPSAPRRILAMLLACLTAYLGMHQLEANHGADLPRALTGLMHALPFLFGPLLYLYTTAASGRWLRLTLGSALHLVPFFATASLISKVPLTPDQLIMLDLVHATHGFGYAVASAHALDGYTSIVIRLGAQTVARDRLVWLWSLVGIYGITGLAEICAYGMGFPVFTTELRVAVVVHWIGAALVLYPQALRHSAHSPRIRFRWNKRNRT